MCINLDIASFTASMSMTPTNISSWWNRLKTSCSKGIWVSLCWTITGVGFIRITSTILRHQLWTRRFHLFPGRERIGDLQNSNLRRKAQTKMYFKEKLGWFMGVPVWGVIRTKLARTMLGQVALVQFFHHLIALWIRSSRPWEISHTWGQLYYVYEGWGKDVSIPTWWCFSHSVMHF